ncbi:hypothetical protein PALS2_079 [Staphylococcus phage PALS_2]|nr:hypothetical protein PALS2_079 [Staphylococcus phage PALS_2]
MEKYYKLTAEGIFDVFKLDKKHIIFPEDKNTIIDFRSKEERIEKINELIYFKDNQEITINSLSNLTDNIVIDKSGSKYTFNHLIEISFTTFSHKKRYNKTINVPNVFKGTVRENSSRSALDIPIDINNIDKIELTFKEYRDLVIKETFK